MKHETLKELRARAKARGIKGYSKLAREELIQLIDKLPTARTNTLEPSLSAKKPRKTKSAPTKSAAGARNTNARPTNKKSPPVEVTATPVVANSKRESTEQLVESAKYALLVSGALTPPRTPDLGEDIDALPVLHEPMVCLLPQKPGVLHAYWHLPPREASLRGDYKLRLYRMTADGAQVHEEIAVASGRGHYYFQVAEGTRGEEMAAQLGYYDKDQFIPAQGRSTARLPTLYASSRTDHRWWVSEQEFAEMYLRAGGVLSPANRFGWSGASGSSEASSPHKDMTWPGSASSSSR